eukprot:4796154-Pyramimonas_sp.AAC.1
MSSGGPLSPDPSPGAGLHPASLLDNSGAQRGPPQTDGGQNWSVAVHSRRGHVWGGGSPLLFGRPKL